MCPDVFGTQTVRDKPLDDGYITIGDFCKNTCGLVGYTKNLRFCCDFVVLLVGGGGLTMINGRDIRLHALLSFAILCHSLLFFAILYRSLPYLPFVAGDAIHRVSTGCVFWCR